MLYIGYCVSNQLHQTLELHKIGCEQLINVIVFVIAIVISINTPEFPYKTRRSACSMLKHDNK